MLGKYQRFDIEFYNQMTNESKKFVVKTWEELDQVQTQFSELKNQEDENAPYWKFIKEKIVRCSCGNEIACNNFTNTCRCGADYSFDGSLLADRSQWGEETGESLADILAVDRDW